MNIFITGNMGYIGGSVVQQLRLSYPEAVLTGYDTGYFSECTTGDFPELFLDKQYFGDIRNVPLELLADVDAIVHLAAISNDPMGNAYEKITLEINYQASIDLARKAKQSGVKSFVFASSCSVYGEADNAMRSEKSPVNPLTAYAKSKVLAEQELEALANKNFKVTCLRFPTASGMSKRLRLDLVLNDFVAAALTEKKITILSDGSPWRPLINVKDMGLAIDWALSRSAQEDFLLINVGSESANYRVLDLAHAVTQIIPGVEIAVNPNALPDKRSYKVDFSHFKLVVPEVYQPQYDLTTTITELKSGLEALNFQDKSFRQSSLMRLNHLNQLRKKNFIDGDLFWSSPNFPGGGSGLPK